MHPHPTAPHRPPAPQAAPAATPRQRPEILAPAGAPDCLPAAVAGGADAVYFGLRHFNARGRADNVRMAKLPRLLGYLHTHGLQAYLVLNTLLHDDEFDKAAVLAQAAVEAGVDAAIIQDVGLWRFLRTAFPTLSLHASTQMTIHSPEQVALLARLGAERVILARELSLPEIRACCATAAQHGIEIEHFVHGALCYAYSGQCLMSNFAGCRSANRGTCAQNCRFDYDTPTGLDSTLSMRDLALIAAIPELATAGVASFKIEGRLKGPEYVYTTSRIYRAAAEAWAAGQAFDVAAARRDLATVFSRGHAEAWLRGDYGEGARLHRQDAPHTATADLLLLGGSRKRGEVLVQGERPQVGDGYTFSLGPHSDGFLILQVTRGRDADTWQCRVRLAAHGIPLQAGVACYRNASQRQRRAAEQAMAQVALAGFPGGGLPCTLQLSLPIGAPLRLAAWCRDGRHAEVLGPVVAPARGAGLPRDRLRQCVGSLGGSAFQLAELTIEQAEPAFVPWAQLKAARRRLIADLEACPIPEPTRPQLPEAREPRARRTAIWVVVRSGPALAAAFAAGAERVIIDDPTCDLWAGEQPDLGAFATDPRVFLRLPPCRESPNLAHLPPGGVSCGQPAAIAAAQAAGRPAIADQGCNVANAACVVALGELGARAVVLSLENSARDVARLCARLRSAEPALVWTVHGRLTAMFTRQHHHLAAGERQAIRASAREGGLPYLLEGHAGGFSRVLEARECCAPAAAAHSRGLVDAWLLECADRSPAETAWLVEAYTALASGTGDPDRIMRYTSAYADHGYFPGHLAIGSRALDELQDQLADGHALNPRTSSIE